MEGNGGLPIPQWLVRGALIETNQLPPHSARCTGDGLSCISSPWQEFQLPEKWLNPFWSCSGSGFPSHEAGQTPSSEGFRQHELWGWWKGTGEGEHGEEAAPRGCLHPKPAVPLLIPCPENTKCQKNLPETYDFGQSLNDKRGQERAEKLLPLLKPKYIPLAGSFQT